MLALLQQQLARLLLQRVRKAARLGLLGLCQRSLLRLDLQQQEGCLHLLLDIAAVLLLLLLHVPQRSHDCRRLRGAHGPRA